MGGWAWDVEPDTDSGWSCWVRMALRDLGFVRKREGEREGAGETEGQKRKRLSRKRITGKKTAQVPWIPWVDWYFSRF